MGACGEPGVDSMCGQVPLTAALPALMPICPPGTRNTFLSWLRALSVTAWDWQGGVIWSASAITFSIRQTKKKVKILLLSAYAEFEYTQSATTYQISEYLLKPLDEDKLE